MSNTRAQGAPGGRDLILFGIILALAFVGVLIVYPASSVVALRELGDSAYFLKKQLRWLALGLVGMFFFATIPLDYLRRLSLVGIIGAIVLLALVFVPGLGHSVTSASSKSFHRWLAIGPVTLQPSEFAKLAIIIYLAHVLSRDGVMEERYEVRRFIPALALTGLALVLIVLEPQFGTTVCLLGVITVLVFISGFPMIRLFLIFLSSLPILYLLVYFAPYRFARVQVWLEPYKYRFQGGYQLVTSFRAFRDGGFFGTDLAQGFAHRYLTYGHTDFVLALFAENFGLTGIVVLLALFGALLWRGLVILRGVEDGFAFLLGAGVLAMLMLQSLLNMFVVTGITPTTGVSLPFISYGGSSFIVTLCFGGLFLNASRYSSRSSSRSSFSVGGKRFGSASMTAATIAKTT